MTDMRTTGGCLCGAVRYVAHGAPKRVGLCHCATCRKETGSPFAAFAVYPMDKVTVTGKTQLFKAPRLARHFCPTCGSPVFIDESYEGSIGIYYGSLDEPERFVPTYELWVVRRLAWLHHMTELEAHERDRDGVPAG